MDATTLKHDLTVQDLSATLSAVETDLETVTTLHQVSVSLRKENVTKIADIHGQLQVVILKNAQLNHEKLKLEVL